MIRFLLLSLLLLSCSAQASVPTETFARTDGYDSVSISPDGRYLAMRVPMGKDFGLAVIDLVNKTSRNIGAGEERSIAQYDWASSTRLVFTLAENFGFAEAPLATGEILAIDVDGKSGSYIFGWRATDRETGTRFNNKAHAEAWGEVIRTLPNDPQHVMVASYAFVKDADRIRGIAMRVNVHNGQRGDKVASPVSGYVRFAADDTGFVRLVRGYDEQNHSVTYVRSPEKPDWRELDLDLGEIADSTERETLQQFSSDKRTLYLRTRTGSDRLCLVALDLEAGSVTELSCDAVGDVSVVIPNFDGTAPAAALYLAGKPRLHILDIDKRSAKVLNTLQKAFAGQLAVPVSVTADGQKFIAAVLSDRNPGDFYLVDIATMKADYLVSARTWIEPDLMGERRPVVIPARDGSSLHGYLTLPAGSDGKNLPLVTIPHGGPFDAHDDWFWDEDAQLLATHGYAVLQVNFRGSGGYGKNFLEAGRRGWGSVMIDDISDATRWAIAQGHADAKRVCIYGASYGGYAALMSAVREPDLYRCSVGYAGVYDLPRLRKDTDAVKSTRGRRSFDEYIGDDVAQLKQASPVTHIDKLKAAVMIVHGTRDTRTPFSQAEALKDALESRKFPFEWMAVKDEVHGFYRPENRKAFFDKLLAFLGQHIGQPAPPATP